MQRRDAALLMVLFLATGRAFAQETCLRPSPVRSLDDIRFHTLAMRSNWGPAVVDNSCNVLDRGSFGKKIDFFILPPVSTEAKPAYVYIKSYRSFTSSTWDKIKMSRGDGWHSERSTAGKPIKLDSMDDVPFRGTPDKWNELHNAAASPEVMGEKLAKPWHAYADADKNFPSTDLMAFWRTSPDEFNFANGTQTNYLIRFPENSMTPIPFDVGYDKNLKEFRVEFYSSIDALSNQSYRFVFRQ